MGASFFRRRFLALNSTKSVRTGGCKAAARRQQHADTAVPRRRRRGTSAVVGLPPDSRRGHMDYRILGPIEVFDGDREISLGGDKQRALFAALLLDANEVVSADRLIDELWG